MNNTYPPYYAYPSYPRPEPVMPRAPRLHWGWVLALQILTRGFFELAWLIVQANWVRRVRGGSRAFWWTIALACTLPAFFLLMLIMGGALGYMGSPNDTALSGTIAIGLFAFVAVRLVTVFMLRSELQDAPISIPLGGVMTFFFGTTYFQYHLHDYNDAYTPTQTGLGLASVSAPVIREEFPQPVPLPTAVTSAMPPGKSGG